jgi:SOS regulatory protein LexA
MRPTQAAWKWWSAEGHQLPEYLSVPAAEDDIATADETEWITAEGDRTRDFPVVGQVAARVPTLGEENVSGDFPVVGQVAAGVPTLAEENVRDEMSLSNLFRGRYVFLLKVTGDSMAGDYIFKNDYVVVDSDAQCDDGELVVVDVDGEATVKRLWREGAVFHLESSNPKYPPIVVGRGEESTLRGKVIGLIRTHIERRSRNP